MLPLIFPLLRANATILSLVANRIYRHGSAPQGVVKPYITWFLINNRPEDQISGSPCADFDTVQIDCYDLDDTQVETIAYAVRDTLDAGGHANRLIRDTREDGTGLYVVTIETDLIRSR